MTHPDFPTFLENTFKTVSPSADYMHNWHLDLISEKLQAVTERKITRLIINMPPRYLKSVTVSVAWPAWLLGINPSAKIIAASYSQILSLKHSNDARLTMTSEWYAKLFPETILSKDQNEKHKFVTTKRGFRFATSVGGTITGEGGDFLILDDPQNSLQVNSPTTREKTNMWFEQSFLSRLDNKNDSVVVIVMQRLHNDDLTGYLTRKKSPWEILSLPAIAPCDMEFESNKSTIFFKQNEVLHKQRDKIERLEELRFEMGEYAFNAQYMQNPVPQEGRIIKPEWIEYFDVECEYIRVTHSWDTASSKNINADYSVCTIWGEHKNGYHLLDVIRAKLEYPALKRKVVELAKKYPPDVILIENKASGQALIQELREENALPIIAIQPVGDKITRFAVCATLFEARKVALPNYAKWKADYVLEILSFPGSAKDDQVDSTSQFLEYSKKIKIQPGFISQF